MQQPSNMQNKFLIDADIGDDDVTLPSLPAIDVPIIEPVNATVETASNSTTETLESESTEQEQQGGFF